jgi:hypothetical protein
VGRTGISRDWERIYASSAVEYTEPLTSGYDSYRTEILGRMTFIDWNGTGNFPPLGTVIRVWTHHAISSLDSWVFNPTVLLAVEAPAAPMSFNLFHNYPNPFNPSTTISFELPRRTFVSLRIYDILGRELATLVNGTKTAGSYAVQWDASRFASGIYFARLEAGERVLTRKMCLVK